MEKSMDGDINIKKEKILTYKLKVEKLCQN